MRGHTGWEVWEQKEEKWELEEGWEWELKKGAGGGAGGGTGVKDLDGS